MAEAHSPLPNRKIKDITGQRFGALVAISFAEMRKHKAFWSETASRRHSRHRHTAGKKPSSEYAAWAAMKQRCENPKAKQYCDYGGRGVTVCKEWSEDFAAFIAYIGLKPSPSHSLDRIDNNGNYEPGNIRWATKLEQDSNKRTNRLITYKGRTQTLTAWAREIGISEKTLANRIVRGGWPTELAFTRAPHGGTSTKAERKFAGRAVNHAVEAGRIPCIKTMTCCRCGAAADHYHHHLGYNRAHWLDVVPLCHNCHRQSPD